MSTDKITCLLNWHATPYHAPLFVAHKLGYFADEGVKVAILEPNDPSDVTEIIGSGKADLGLKAMIHTIAGKARGFPIKSIGTLLDEPFTGVIYLKSANGITTDFQSLRGKRIGYVGEFGKIQLDELTRHFGMTPEDYTPVRVGMNVTRAIQKGVIDGGIGIENVQMVELEEWSVEQGRPRDDVQMLRIDELAKLGCCCFCSILFIGNEKFINENPEKVAKFMKAIKRAMDFIQAKPEESYELLVDLKPAMNTPVNRKIFDRSFIYFSKDLKNVQRDWNKVTNYCKRLGIVDEAFRQNMTNDFLTWPLLPEVDPNAPKTGLGSQDRVENELPRALEVQAQN
ncbi:NMT1-domain-containing protein [Basidiobolus meristosporus CBS 931.73]|uniref:4-amino-5-hydroxymethyl-2-methylpyrimidine phosphate synthase n=1 Tax=Basidiobolus meristosporus CBS 931.73 TaxID=1314790 RepID=A0A1Y1Y9R4_9FUNG|nr:NMT1-domain-containing protein [Basidiobolus meristosporus CBS 931.73]|eukprot:ORX94732.1 NMT1-domain-containing protein [Basidiobolus meristosporus CBS 931.73]